jgi:ABC-2 type transport system ATP-binding protein
MIEVRELTRYYGHTPVIEGVSFKIARGEIVGLLGLNGAGKTTTMRVLAGVLSPSSGSVTVDGTDVVGAPDDLKRRIGFLPETPPQYEDMTVAAFLAHAGRLKGMSSADVKRRIPEVVAQAHLEGRENQVISTLSHGYRKRVGVAQTVIHNPSLVILDEPISGLDPVQIVEMRRVIRNLGEGRAVLISSHILNEISQTCDRLVVLHGGRKIAEGTEAELTRRLGDTRIVITVRGGQREFEAWLQANPRVEHCFPRVVPAPFASAIVDLHGDIREQFIPEIAAAGFGVRLVEVPDDELEEIFLGLTRTGATA